MAQCRMPGTSNPHPVVVDTNTFVAAAFNKHSHSAHIFDEIREGQLKLVWNDATLGEIRKVVKKIPPIDWEKFAHLFTGANRYDGDTNEDAYKHVPDATDRKFAALAAATNAVLITQDDHLLKTREQGDVDIVAPGEYFARRTG